MKKLLIIMVLVLGLTGTAMAVPYYDYQVPSIGWLNANHPDAAWTFNLNTDALRVSASNPAPVDINAEDTINTAWLGINFTDDESDGYWFLGWWIPGEREYGNISLDGSFAGNFEINSGLYQANVRSYLVSDHTLRVDIHCTSGDFGILSSSLSGDYTDNPATNPVPEPATILLLGPVLVILAMRRKKY